MRDQPQFTTAPSIIANPNPRAPLAAVVRFEVDRPVHTTLTVDDGRHRWALHFPPDRVPDLGLPVVGMRPDRQHQIRVAIRDVMGQETVAPESLTFTPPPLPTDPNEFPPLRINIPHPDRVEPGVTLMSVRRRAPSRERIAFGQQFGMLLALDEAGEVVWYYRFDSRISDFEPLPNGNIIFLTQDYRAIEIDLLGNEVTTWYATGRPKGPVDGIPVQTMTFHHDLLVLPNGNLVVLGTESRSIDNYYTSEIDPDAPRRRQNVMGDQIIEFQPDGQIVWQWNAFDHLDPFRIGYETFSDYWVRRGFPNTVDWSHANSLLYDPKDDSLLVSMRYQAAILKIDRARNEIRWILGEPSGWPEQLQSKLLRPSEPLRWFYHQHAPCPTPHGTIILFDNGNYRQRPFTPPLPPAQTYSRAVEYLIDEARMTVREGWVSEGPGSEAVVSFAMGDVDWLPQRGNILVTYGFLLPSERLEQISWGNVLDVQSWTRVREYSHTTPAELIWEVVLDGRQAANPIGWTVFGSARAARLHP